MGYRVIYLPVPESARKRSRLYYRSILTSFFLALFLLLVNFSWPRGREVLRQLLFPGKSVLAVWALNDLAAELSYGESWGDALSGIWQAMQSNAG